MATAVEKASVVLICFSENYKGSPNCRTGCYKLYSQLNTSRTDLVALTMLSPFPCDLAVNVYEYSLLSYYSTIGYTTS